MHIGIILIGDELLSGKRTDKHMPKVIDLLHERGLELRWCRIVGDDPEILVATLRDTMAGGDLVISFGGIGATPDDRTRQAAAEAAGVPLVRHPEASRILQRKFGERAFPQRIQMADFPEGASIIPNSFNEVPGFSLGDHHFVPGFPEMAWPMVEWVLDERYPHLRSDVRPAEYLLRVYGRAEGDMVPVMEALAREYPDVRLASLPHIDAARPFIELGVRDAPDEAERAHAWLRERLSAKGIEWEDAGRHR